MILTRAGQEYGLVLVWLWWSAGHGELAAFERERKREVVLLIREGIREALTQWTILQSH